METIRIRPIPIVETEVVMVRQAVQWQKPRTKLWKRGKFLDLQEPHFGVGEARRRFKDRRRSKVTINHDPTNLSPVQFTKDGREKHTHNRDQRFIDQFRQMQTRLSVMNYTGNDIVYMDHFGVCTTIHPDHRLGYSDEQDGCGQFSDQDPNTRDEGYIVVRQCYEFDYVEDVRSAYETMSRNMKHLHEKDLLEIGRAHV